jgi:hypothetical protein
LGDSVGPKAGSYKPLKEGDEWFISKDAIWLQNKNVLPINFDDF